MKHFLRILLLQFSLSALAVTYETKIHAIEKGYSGDPHLVMMRDGYVGFLEDKVGNQAILDELEEVHSKDAWVEIVLDDKLNLKSAKKLVRSEDEFWPPDEVINPAEGQRYSPSIISYNQAQSIFRGMRTDYQNESQCYNRAHIWTYEAYRRTGLKSNKLFLFFTTKYIRAYRYGWWFHVTPMVYVEGSDQLSWHALDKRYAAGPLTLRNWTNIFMHNNARCPVVYRYSSYSQRQYDQWCYLIPTSMYFWQPRDIERFDRTGYKKTNYISSEVNHAYWEAF